MRNDIYMLPYDVFVGGQYLRYKWRLVTRRGTPFSTEGFRGDFSVVNSSHRFEAPHVSVPVKFSVGTEGIQNIISVEIFGEDTKEMFGKYLYQITLVDPDGNPEIPYKGIFMVSNNFNKDFIN